MAPLSGRRCSPASDAFLVVQPPSSREAVLLLPRDNQKLFQASFCLRILLYFLIALFLLVSYLLAQWVSSAFGFCLVCGCHWLPPSPPYICSSQGPDWTKTFRKWFVVSISPCPCGLSVYVAGRALQRSQLRPSGEKRGLPGCEASHKHNNI